MYVQNVVWAAVELLLLPFLLGYISSSRAYRNVTIQKSVSHCYRTKLHTTTYIENTQPLQLFPAQHRCGISSIYWNLDFSMELFSVNRTKIAQSIPWKIIWMVAKPIALDNVDYELPIYLPHWIPTLRFLIYRNITVVWSFSDAGFRIIENSV